MVSERSSAKRATPSARLDREVEDNRDTEPDAKCRNCVIVVIYGDSIHTSSPSDAERLPIFASEHQAEGFVCMP